MRVPGFTAENSLYESKDFYRSSGEKNSRHQGVIISNSTMHVTPFADPKHCDRPGYPSCESVGYNDGVRDASKVSEKDNFVPPCPRGHSKNYCDGYTTGYGDELNDRFG
jgi:hypothetical protein